MAYMDVEKHRASVKAMKGPTHITEGNNWKFNTPFNNHNDGSAYAEKMVKQGIWKRCKQCEGVYSPRYGHECSKVEAV